MADSFLIKPAHLSVPELTVSYYLQDPAVAKSDKRLGVYTDDTFPGEPTLGPGPTSSRVAVVDYNGDLDEVLEPVRVLASGKGFKIGRKQPLANVAFHQVNVWAVITRTLNLLEAPEVLGRRIPWASGKGRLLVMPHAGYWENAFYDRATGALHFFYFEGRNGEQVYTCLSHDIVTHELGHAVLDGLKPHYNEVSSPATAGFHEFFGDAVALSSAMTHRDLMVATAGTKELDLNEGSLLSGIAAEFGQALAPENDGPITGQGLRSALNTVTMDDLVGVFEEHLYSEVLTGAYFDFLKLAYNSRLESRRKPGKPKFDGRDRVGALISASRLTTRMFFRALDYCPPADVSYLDYARAVIAADRVAHPVDRHGYRAMVTEVFLGRKIIADQRDLEPPDMYEADEPGTLLTNRSFRDLDVEVIGASNTDAYGFIDANRDTLKIPGTANLEVCNVYRTNKISQDGYFPPREIIVEFVWTEDVELTGPEFGNLSGATMPLWCGGTIVFNRDGNVLYYVAKSDSPERRSMFGRYIADLVARRAISMDDGETGHGARADGANRISGRVEDGRVRLRPTSALRHADTPRAAR